jgi:hypothetical protein
MKDRSLLAIGLLALTLVGGCGGAFKGPPPVIIEHIDTTESAILVPIVGDNTQQAGAQTEEFFKKNLVFAKQIEMPVYWQVLNRQTGSGEWRQSARLIKVDRKLVNRTWTKDGNTGTSSQDQSISAEDSSSIAFYAHMTCTAGVDEKDVPVFLYRFKQASLETVMDENIRPMVAELFAAECSKRSMEEILKNRTAIMDGVREKVILYFKNMGVDIQILGLVGELTYSNPATQAAIDKVFQASRDREAAAAKAETAKLLAVPANMEYMRLQMEQRKLDIAEKQVEKWDGHWPTTMAGGGNGMNLFLNSPGNK